MYDNSSNPTTNSNPFTLSTGSAEAAACQSANVLPSADHQSYIGSDFLGSKDEKIQLNNVVSVSTVISNINTINSASVSSSSSTAQAISALGLSGPGYSKSYFDLRLKLVSTINTQDVYLERFISVANAQSNHQLSIDARQTYHSHDGLLRQVINDLCYVDSETFVKYLFIILDKLLHLMITVRIF